MTGPSRRHLWGTFLVVGASLLFVAGTVWVSLSQATIPQQQRRISMPGMEDDLLNFWADPDPPRVGQTKLIAKVTSPIGSPRKVDTVVFSLSRPGQPPALEAQGDYRAEESGKSQMYVATVNLDPPGPWHVAVRFTTAQVRGEAVFRIEVKDQ